LDWNERLDNYCERIGPEFWAEPLNAVSNLSFVVAALWAYVLWRRQTPGDWPALFLIVVVLATGVGSFLFHTVATRWAMLTDVVPIAIFIHGYLLLALRRYLGLPWWAAIALVAVFLVATPYIAGLAQPVAASSAGYVPALLAIFTMAALVRPKGQGLSKPLFVVGLLFLISLTFRTIDAPLCTALEVGTHFLWHMFNGLVLFLLLRLLISQRAGYTP